MQTVVHVSDNQRDTRSTADGVEERAAPAAKLVDFVGRIQLSQHLLAECGAARLLDMEEYQSPWFHGVGNHMCQSRIRAACGVSIDVAPACFKSHACGRLAGRAVRAGSIDFDSASGRA
jgi:hypothetical protein